MITASFPPKASGMVVASSVTTMLFTNAQAEHS